ncbi:hypothetical protein PIB30_075135 [Stylosanthes scabra]|uniref:Uncharacterized protein n=1 Tax=Stylosanthes scabra TaxID=79078 RepID=A0ABU6TQK1_9FABA|nr:hypothetical protein [Stylosanthes scabra]
MIDLEIEGEREGGYCDGNWVSSQPFLIPVSHPYRAKPVLPYLDTSSTLIQSLKKVTLFSKGHVGSAPGNQKEVLFGSEYAAKALKKANSGALSLETAGVDLQGHSD